MGAQRVCSNRSIAVLSLSLLVLVGCSGESSDSPADADGTPTTEQTGVAPVSLGTTPTAASVAGPTDASQPATTATTPSSGPPEAEVTAARTIIDAATMDAAGAESVDAVRFTDAGQVAAEQALAEGATGPELWAATWIYTSTATDPAPLVPLLATPNLDTRALAAAGALSFGEIAGASVLVALLDDGDQIAGSEPPLTIGQFAAATLARYIDAPEISADAAPPDLIAPWTEWLAGPGSSIVFDPESGRWTR